MPGSDDNKRQHSVDDINNWNLNRNVDPPTAVRGLLGYNSSQAYEYVSSNANHLLVSGTFNATSSPLSADSSSVSAKQGDAGLLRTSAIQGDAGLLRISAIGVSVSTSPLSADSSSISAKQDSATNLNVSAKSLDAGLLRTSSIIDSGSISAKNQDANFMHVSGFSPDAGLLRISAIQAAGLSSVGAASFGVSAAQNDAGALHASAFVDGGSISAKSADANQLHVSSVQGDAGLQRTSAISVDATNLVVSAVQKDSALLRVSASLFPDTTGGLTIFNTLSVSASQSVKGSAGALYGYYLYNTDTKPNYVKFYNVSGASNIGTDAILLEVCLPASAAANMEYPHGLAGFTNGINITATSGRPADNTALPAASSVGAVLFYK